jgi:hypothetical protein
VSAGNAPADYAISSGQHLNLHDGRYASLEDSLGERLAAYRISEADINDDVALAPGEMQALIAFLEALTGRIDERYLSN